MLLFYDSSFNIIPTVGIEKTTNNIDGTINNLDDDRSGEGDEAIKKLIDYSNDTKWYGGHNDNSTANGTMKIKLWGQPVYYRFVTAYDNNNYRMITSWTMYDHTLNKISNEYFFNDEYYLETVQNQHYYPVDSTGNSSGYFSFNDNDFIDDIYDCDLNSSEALSKIEDSDSSFLVGRVYQLINLTGSATTTWNTLARGDNTSGFGSNDWFGPAASKSGIIGVGSVGTAYIKIFANITTENNGTPTTYSKGFKFITNATFKSFDMTKVENYYDTLYYQQPKGHNRQALINNSIYRIDNITASNAGYIEVYGDNDYGYSMNGTKLKYAAIHSGVLTNGETGSIYIKCFDVLLNNFPSTLSNGITSYSSDYLNNSEYSFKIYDVPSMIN